METIYAQYPEAVFEKTAKDCLIVADVRRFTEDNFPLGDVLIISNIEIFHAAVLQTDEQTIMRLMRRYLNAGRLQHADHLGEGLAAAPSAISPTRFATLAEWLQFTRRWRRLADLASNHPIAASRVANHRHVRNGLHLSALATNSLAAVVPYHVISLPSAVHRQTQICSDFDDLGIASEPAISFGINGRELPLALSKAYDMTVGALGCSLSHMALWERIAATDVPCAVVLEDDARILAPVPASIVQTFLATELDILWLTERRHTIAFRADGDPPCFTIQACDPRAIGKGTEGYLIKRAAAGRIAAGLAEFMGRWRGGDVDNFISAACMRAALEAGTQGDQRNGPFYRRTIDVSMVVPSIRAGMLDPYLILHFDMGISAARP